MDANFVVVASSLQTNVGVALTTCFFALVLAKPVRLEELVEGVSLVLGRSGERRPAENGRRLVPVPR